MTIKFGKDGKITIEPTPGNVKGIAELVLQQFEELAQVAGLRRHGRQGRRFGLVG